MAVKRARINVERASARLAYIKEKSPNKEIGVLVVKELVNCVGTKRMLSARKPSSAIKNKKVHRRFVGNLMTAVSNKVTIEICE